MSSYFAHYFRVCSNKVLRKELMTPIKVAPKVFTEDDYNTLASIHHADGFASSTYHNYSKLISSNQTNNFLSSNQTNNLLSSNQTNNFISSKVNLQKSIEDQENDYLTEQSIKQSRCY